MTDFKQIKLSDKDWIDPLLRLSDHRGAEYCFTNLYAWRHVYQTKVSRLHNWLLIRSGTTDIFPAGDGDVKLVIETLFKEAVEERRDFKIAGAGAEQVALIEKLFPKRFEVAPMRDSWDYIYKAEDLSTLSGKRYQSKRNHIARFIELPDWHYESITEHNIPECIEMNNKWCQQMGCADNKSLHTEVCVAEEVLQNFKTLNVTGALLRVHNKVVAYTIGEPINSDTYIVHIEKAFPDVRGAYQMINRSFVKDVAPSFAYINREDDAGDEGLRRAKESYHPVFMQEKYSLQWRYTV